MRLSIVGAGLAPALLLALLCTGCAPHQAVSPKPTKNDSALSISLSTQPSALRQLDTTQLTVQVADKRGQSVTGAIVTVQLTMPTMDMGRNEVALHEAATSLGIYQGTGRFTMPGDWQAVVQVETNGQHAEKTVPAEGAVGHEFMSDAGNEQGTIGGGWLGTYAYKGVLKAQPPVRFEATLTEPDSDGKFSGTILDDGNLGEANVSGEQSGRGIRFAKVYQQRTHPTVSYEGTLSDDGRTMTGTWQIAGVGHGVWDARRTWSNSGDSEAEEDAAEDIFEERYERERTRQREVVRLG